MKTYRRTQTSSGRRVIVRRDEHRIVHHAGTAFGRTFRMDLPSAIWALLAPVRRAGVASPMSAGGEELTSSACDAQARVGVPHRVRRCHWSARVSRLLFSAAVQDDHRFASMRQEPKALVKQGGKQNDPYMVHLGGSWELSVRSPPGNAVASICSDHNNNNPTE